MGAMFDPQLAALNLMPDGNPVKLELAQLDEFADEAWVALSDDALAISVGEGSETNAGNMLVAESADPAPFFSMTMDTARGRAEPSNQGRRRPSRVLVRSDSQPAAGSVTASQTRATSNSEPMTAGPIRRMSVENFRK